MVKLPTLVCVLFRAVTPTRVFVKMFTLFHDTCILCAGEAAIQVSLLCQHFRKAPESEVYG